MVNIYKNFSFVITICSHNNKKQDKYNNYFIYVVKYLCIKNKTINLQIMFFC